MSIQRKGFLNAPRESCGQTRPLTFPYIELEKERVEQPEGPFKPNWPLRTRSATSLHSWDFVRNNTHQETIAKDNPRDHTTQTLDMLCYIDNYLLIIVSGFKKNKKHSNVKHQTLAHCCPTYSEVRHAHYCFNVKLKW